jgi:hypothetical protein
VDIRRYTNVALTFVLPVLFLLLGGIPLPGGAVLVNHGAIRSRAARSLVSFAGPAVNLVLGLALVLTVAAVPMAGRARRRAVVPRPDPGARVRAQHPAGAGLDGFGVLEPFLPPGAGARSRRCGRGRRWCCWWCCWACRGRPRCCSAIGDVLFGLIGGNAASRTPGTRSCCSGGDGPPPGGIAVGS